MASGARLPQPISEGAASLVWAPVLALRTGHPMSPCSVPHPTRSSQYDEQGQMAHDPGPKRTPLPHQEQPEAENVTHALQGCHGNGEIQSCLMGLNSHSYLLSDQERAGWEKFTQRQDTRCLHQTLTPGSPALPSPQLRARQEGSTSSRHDQPAAPQRPLERTTYCTGNFPHPEGPERQPVRAGEAPVTMTRGKSHKPCRCSQVQEHYIRPSGLLRVAGKAAIVLFWFPIFSYSGQ